MIVGSQQVIPSIINPVNHVICYDADVWDENSHLRYHGFQFFTLSDKLVVPNSRERVGL